MTFLQSERLKEFQQLKAAFDKYATTWSANVSLSADISLFLLNLVSIEAQAVLQEVNTTGIGQTKKTLRSNLIDQATLAATAVRTFASKIKNQTLAATVYYKESHLKKSRETDLVVACQVIMDQATEHVASLGDYGVNANTLTELQTSLDKFRSLTPQPQTAILSGKAFTQNLASLFRDTNKLVKENIDGLLLQYKKKAPNFHTAYFHARAVGREVRKAKKEVGPVQPVAVTTPVF